MPNSIIKDFSAEAEITAARQAKLQKQQQRHDMQDMQARLSQQAEQSRTAPGPEHEEPAPPLPTQRLKKPGTQAEMQLQPQCMARDYQGSAKLAGKVAIITGGDSGIGRAVAVLFAREGAHVAIAYLNEHEDAAETCRLIEAEGGQSLAVSGDVQDAAFCTELVARVLEKFGSINVLVNNAAFQEHAQHIEDITDQRLEETFKTNIFGYFHMVQATLPYLSEGDCIINTGSVTGIRGSKNLLDYSATKGAIHAFTKALASNLAERNIRVNAVAPGPVWTPLNPADKSAHDVMHFGAHTDMKRPAQPEEISPAYVFLAAPACSSYITGVVLPITGTAADG